MKAVFMGTPEIAATILDSIAKSGIEVLAVVTQPDKPKGRGKEMSFSEVKETALQHGFQVLQPERMKEEWFLDRIRNLNPDVVLVAAFGQLLPKVLLDIPRYGCINVHASLLPRYRGASPIQWAIMNGDETTGITIMYMAKGLDTGDMILQKEIAIDEKETGGSLHDKLAVLGAGCLMEALQMVQAGTAKRTVQEESLATYVSVLQKSDGLLDFTLPAEVLERKVRGLNPWPSAYTYFDGRILKIWEAEVVEEPHMNSLQQVLPGTVIQKGKDFIDIVTGKGFLKLKQVQLEGKKRMSCGDFLRGCHVEEGSRFG